MKKRVFSILIALSMIVGLLPMVLLSAQAATHSGTCGDNVTWELDTSTGVLTISGTGEMENYTYSRYDFVNAVYSGSTAPWYSKRSFIETAVIGDGVTSIGSFAFANCSKLTGVTIGDGVANIGNCAFYRCTGLADVTMGDSVTRIGSYAFENCSSLTEMKLPDSVTTIEKNAFYDCESLTNVTMGNSVTSIGVAAFAHCSKLTGIVIPDSVTTLGYEAFVSCYGLTKVTIGANVTGIGSHTFAGCLKLSELTIGESVTRIDMYAFNDCESLTGVTIPNAVTIIGDSAFAGCRQLSVVALGTGVTSIGDSVFLNCSRLTNVTIPSSVTSIGNAVFFGCNSLSNISVAEGNSFYSGDSEGVLFNKDKTRLICCPAAYVGTYSMPNSVVSIDEFAFYGCSRLTGVTIGDKVTSIGKRAFYGCSSLTGVVIPESMTSIGEQAFSGCDSLLSTVILSTSCAIYNMSGNLGESDTNVICGYADSTAQSYAQTYGYTFVAIDCDAQQHGYANGICAVCGAEQILSGTCGEGSTWSLNVASGELTISGTGATSREPWSTYRTFIHNVTIENGVTGIHMYAFRDCSNLTDVKLGDSVESFERSAFDGCGSLTGIWVSEGNATYSSDASGVLFNKDKTTLVCCPVGYSGTYDIPDSVINIDYSAFQDCSGLTGVTIPDGVTSIELFTFNNCSSLTDVTIPGSVTTIGYESFFGCNNLQSITIPGSVTSIDSGAFSGCNGLRHVHFLGNMPTIASDAFSQYSPDLTLCYLAEAEGWENCTYNKKIWDHTVTTICDGTVFVCNECGEEYTTGTGEHSWKPSEIGCVAPTCTEEGRKVYVCSICGEEKTEIIVKIGHSYENGACIHCGAKDPYLDTSLVFYAKRMDLQSYINVNYIVRNSVAADYDRFFVSMKREDGSVTVLDGTAMGTAFTYFSLRTAAPEMTENLAATIFAIKDGKVYHGETVNWCVRDGVMEQMNAITDLTNEENRDRMTLMVDMLNYGAAAQIRFDNRTDDLANNKMTEAQLACGTTATPIVDASIEEITNDGAMAKYINKTLSLQSSIEMQLMINIKGYTAADLEARIVYGDKTDVADLQTYTSTLAMLVYDGIAAKDVREAVEITVYHKTTGEVISNTVKCSIEALAKQMLPAQADIVHAMMRFGDSANKVYG